MDHSNVLAQSQIIPLWGAEVPNAIPTTQQEVREQKEILRISMVKNPSMEVFLPTKRSATGQAVIICPGGGYKYLSYDWEGTEFAKLLNANGIAAFVLKSRLPEGSVTTNPTVAPLQDAQRAIRLVRQRAEEWQVDPAKVGIMGFSAGGHLASTLATHYDREVYPPRDASDTQSARPDFAVLIYPVITMMDNYTHQGSKRQLLGENPSEELVVAYSNERQITANTPPTFLLHAADDGAVPVMNSVQFYEALQGQGVSAEMHLYPSGGHGFGLAIGMGRLQTWPDHLLGWLHDLNP